MRKYVIRSQLKPLPSWQVGDLSELKHVISFLMYLSVEWLKYVFVGKTVEKWYLKKRLC